MNDLVPDRLDELLTRSAMAKQSGVASTTLANWAAREQAPLATVQAPSGDAMYTWRHLLGFCRANPKLHATRQVLEQYRERFATDPLSHPPEQSTSIEAAAGAGSQVATVGPSSGDGATLRSALQDLKTQVDEHSAVVAAAVKLADHAAGVQQTLVASVALLEAAVAALPGNGS
ncbi:hypothetical protein K3U93_06275 [Mycobacterium malmoense]|nr:hypothetical protein [Mycobacterium malmoense]QZA18773.1 hypothetical protein K3U93_06275 [Mycobacterium malmoense]UNB95543.1 hypothetical protein H5T25_06270 [Mycobacterium malmoense]